MNKNTAEMMEKATQEIDEALIELSQAAADYEKRRKAAQQKLTMANGKLQTLASIAKG